MDNENDNEETTPRPTDQRPLGYWLRAVDGLLTQEFADALEGEGVTRRDWMLLNALSGDVAAPGLQERLARKGKRLRALEERGLIAQQGDGTWSLTDLGIAEKERLGDIIDGIRSRIVDAVGDEAFATTMTSLEAIARELGWDESTAGRHEFGFGRFGRPRPFAPDVRFGWGPNLHRGFEPGDRPFGHGHPHASRGHHEGHGHPHSGHHGHDHQCAEHHGHGHPHGGHHRHEHHGHHGHGHAHRGGGRSAQRAYERGFDAGFARGRGAGAA